MTFEVWWKAQDMGESDSPFVKAYKNAMEHAYAEGRKSMREEAAKVAREIEQHTFDAVGDPRVKTAPLRIAKAIEQIEP